MNFSKTTRNLTAYSKFLEQNLHYLFKVYFTLQYFTWQAIWHVNSSVKIHSLSQSHVWTLAVSLNCEKKSWPQSKRKFWRGLLYNCFPSGWKTLCHSSSSSPRLNTSTKQKLPKMPRKEAKIYQERILLSTEGHISIFLWLLPDFSLFIGRCIGRFAFVRHRAVFSCEL